MGNHVLLQDPVDGLRGFVERGADGCGGEEVSSCL